MNTLSDGSIAIDYSSWDSDGDGQAVADIDLDIYYNRSFLR